MKKPVKNNSVHLRLDEPSYDFLARVADETKLSVQDFLRLVVKQAMIADEIKECQHNEDIPRS